MGNTVLSYLNQNNIMLTGVDPGNTSTKVSFLNNQGAIESFSIPTVIAQTDQPTGDMKGVRGDNNTQGIRQLYIHLETNALDDKFKDRYWFVGQFAKNKQGIIQPEVDNNGRSVDKFNSMVHIVTMLTGLAVAAVKSGKNKVDVPLSTGLPIAEHKLRGGDRFLDNLKGTHTITFLEGEYQGQTVELSINDGEVHVEGVTSTLALEFTIENGEFAETSLANKLGDEFVINDLGAGTTDKALYTEDGLDSFISNSDSTGTNQYIDQMIKDIEDLDVVRKVIEEENSFPFKTREEFMDKVIIPEIMKVIDDKSYTPQFKFSWGWDIKGLDVSKIVVDHMVAYANEVLSGIRKFTLDNDLSNVVIVGGGLLFGYLIFKDYNNFIYPPDLKIAPQITSTSYLIANYLNVAQVVLA